MYIQAGATFQLHYLSPLSFSDTPMPSRPFIKQIFLCWVQHHLVLHSIRYKLLLYSFSALTSHFLLIFLAFHSVLQYREVKVCLWLACDTPAVGHTLHLCSFHGTRCVREDLPVNILVITAVFSFIKILLVQRHKTCACTFLQWLDVWYAETRQFIIQSILSLSFSSPSILCFSSESFGNRTSFNSNTVIVFILLRSLARIEPSRNYHNTD